MGRKEKETRDLAVIEKILAEGLFCRLAMADANEPYVVPLCYGYRDGILYFHCGAWGTKLEFIRKNPRVCFEVTSHAKVIPGPAACGFSVEYASVVGHGAAHTLTDPEAKKAALDLLMERYAEPPFHYAEKGLAHVEIIAVTVETAMAKRSPAPA